MAKLKKMPEGIEENDASNATDGLGLSAKLKVIDDDVQEKKQRHEFEGKKKDRQKQINFRISEANFDKYNKLFGSKGVSFSRAVRMWLDFGYNSIMSGTLDMSEAGIRSVTLSQLR